MTPSGIATMSQDTRVSLVPASSWNQASKPESSIWPQTIDMHFTIALLAPGTTYGQNGPPDTEGSASRRTENTSAIVRPQRLGPVRVDARPFWLLAAMDD